MDQRDQLIDDILSEVQQMRGERRAAANEASEDTVELLRPAKVTPPAEVTVVPEENGDDAPAVLQAIPTEAAAPAAEDDDSDEDMKIVGGAPGVSLPPEEEQTREIPHLTPEEASTRRITAFDANGHPIAEPAADKGAVSKKASEQMEGQISFNELVDEPEEPAPEEEPAAEQPPAPEEPLSWEERLQRVREEKIKNFRLNGEEKPEKPEEEPEEEPVEEAAPEEDDFNDIADAGAVAAELQYHRRSAFFGMVFSALAEAVLIWLAALLYMAQSINVDVMMYLGVHVVLLGGMMVVHRRLLMHGVSALFHLDPDGDTVVALPVILTLVHTVLQMIFPRYITQNPVILLPAAAGVILLAGGIGRWSRICRMQENFRFIASKGDKLAAHMISDSEVAKEIGKSTIAIGDPEVLYFKKTGFLSGFLHKSCEEKEDRRLYVEMLSIVSGAALILAVLYGLLSHSATVMSAFTVFCSVVLLSTPLSVLTIENLPLRRAARKALRRGSMIVSWSAVETFGQPNAVMMDAMDLFPQGNVILHGIKTFSGTRIDTAIVDAASVTVQAGGPLSGVFLRVIENKTDILQEVDTLVYEQEMGLSGWVDGRRVLVGNRRLLENHGVDVPSRDYENKYARGGRKLVYLSVAGELSAMFVISYLADEDIRVALKELCDAGVTLLVRTCDPNITEQVVREAFDLDPYCVEVMTAAPARTAEQLVEGCDQAQEACLASNGRVEGMAVAVTGCTRLPRVAAVGRWVMLGFALVGMILAAVTLIGSGKIVAPIVAVIYLAASAIITALVQRCLRV